MRLLTLIMKYKGISASKAKEEFMEGVSSNFKERREELFIAELKSLKEKKLIYELENVLYYMHSPDAKKHICKCDKCEKYFLVIDYAENEKMREDVYKINGIYEIEDERANEGWALYCPYCYPQNS